MKHLAGEDSPGRSVSAILAATAAIVAVVALAVLTSAPVHAGDTASREAAWAAIAQFRAQLEEQSPLTVEFVQTYVPAGFSSGDSEQGVLRIALPDCLRWDYSDPFPKSFLLCRDTAWYWNPGETVGQRYGVDQQTPGLDFFLLPTATLESRYGASSELNDDGSVTVTLIPTQPSDDVVSATLRLSAKHRRLEVLGYTDVEGNRTRFEMADYLTRQSFDTSLFAPPEDVEWQDPQ